jgi:hypothetical protein
MKFQPFINLGFLICFFCIYMAVMGRWISRRWKMPLFACTSCDAIDNTAISDYWGQQFDATRDGKPFEPKCSECYTGKWHGKFPKRLAEVEGYVPDPNMPGFIMPKGGWK